MVKWLKVIHKSGVRYFNAAQISDLTVTADDKTVNFTIQTAATTAVYSLSAKELEPLIEGVEETIHAMTTLTDPVYTLDLRKFAATE